MKIRKNKFGYKVPKGRRSKTPAGYKSRNMMRPDLWPGALKSKHRKYYGGDPRTPDY